MTESRGSEFTCRPVRNVYPVECEGLHALFQPAFAQLPTDSALAATLLPWIAPFDLQRFGEEIRNMRLPGFTAEETLHSKNEIHNGVATPAESQGVVPQFFKCWGNVCCDEYGNCFHKGHVLM